MAGEEGQEDGILQNNNKEVVDEGEGVGENSCFFFCYSTNFPFQLQDRQRDRVKIREQESSKLPGTAKSMVDGR